MSHVIAVLPLRRWMPTSGLVIGAMVPDLPYYVPLPFSGVTTHDWRTGWAADLLAGFGVLALFHLLLRAPLTALAPDRLRARLPGLASRTAGAGAPTWMAAGVVMGAAILTGTATHLAWDAFTHVDGAVVTHWPVMRLPVAGVHRVFNVVMYVSSLAGLVVLAGALARWYRHAPVRPGPWPGLSRRSRRMVFGAAAAGAVAGAVLLGTGDGAAAGVYDLVRAVLLGGITGAGAVLGGYVPAWHLYAAGECPALINFSSTGAPVPLDSFALPKALRRSGI
ncbi:DUF4184 family protein [Sphaerisporangium melleum]|uniref:DUF4184 family protein n=1 Tax=Sphaerisporangium melleum TaxID=321316 RepID=UPI00227C14CA|nr:DUF4184 family protein [Sphaerisporangium melleum]